MPNTITPNQPNLTTAQLAQYYANLLIAQYKTKPKANATVVAAASAALANLVYQQVLQGYDLTTAIGKQLDVLGTYVGAYRVVPNYNPTIIYKGLPRYTDSVPGSFGGLARYTDTQPPGVYFLRYATQLSTATLTDGMLRQLIQYLIAVHNCNHSNASIDLILKNFFGGYATLTDGANMSITYIHQLADPSVFFSLISFLGWLPRPAGVNVIVEEV